MTTLKPNSDLNAKAKAEAEDRAQGKAKAGLKHKPKPGRILPLLVRSPSCIPNPNLYKVVFVDGADVAPALQAQPVQ